MSRWCKKCRVVFHDATCPEGHPNFMYTSKLGMDSPQEPPPVVSGAPETAAPAPQVAAPQVQRLRQASETERLQTEAALAAAREVLEEEAALDSELLQVEEETKRHWEVQTGAGL